MPELGPLKRVDDLEYDMRAPPTFDVVRKACIAGFNMKGFDCDILETERGPCIENLNEVKNFNDTFFVRFIHKQYTVTKNVLLTFFTSFRFSIDCPRSVSSISQSSPFMLKPAIQVLLTTSIVGDARMSPSGTSRSLPFPG
jgi:hypothetical protein